MVKKKFVIKEETRKRCKIVRFDAKISPRFEIISTELLHFLYNTAQLDFAIYFRVKHELIEFIPPGPLSKELVDQLIHGIELGDADVDVRILKADHDRFQHLLGTVLDLAIYANVHLRHAANSTHVDPAPFNC